MPPDFFTRELATVAADSQLNDALGALASVARALGIFEDTWTCQGIEEVGEVLAGEVRRLKALAARRCRGWGQ